VLRTEADDAKVKIISIYYSRPDSAAMNYAGQEEESLREARPHSIRPPAPMNHVKYLRAGPAEMPFQNWYTANTNHFTLTDSVIRKSKRQLG